MSVSTSLHKQTLTSNFSTLDLNFLFSCSECRNVRFMASIFFLASSFTDRMTPGKSGRGPETKLIYICCIFREREGLKVKGLSAYFKLIVF